MIVYQDNQRLYLSSWEYNAARILSRLAILIDNNGGSVKPLHSAIISNRSIYDKIQKKKEESENWIKFSKNHPEHREKAERAAARIQEEITETEKAIEDPITVTHTSYIVFTLDGIYYYLSLNDNPFMEFHYIKTAIRPGNKYSKDAAAEDFTKDWLFDCYLTGSANNEEIKEAAALIYNAIELAPESKIIRSGRRQRVPNRYNNSYHYETIYAPERIGTVEF